MEEDKDSPCCGKEGGWIIQSTDLGSYCSKCKEPVGKVYAPVGKRSHRIDAEMRQLKLF